MMRKTHLRFFVASCVFSLLPAGLQAQEAQSPAQPQSQTQPREQNQQREQNQPRGQAQQGERAQQNNQAQRNQDRQPGQAQHAAGHHADKSVEHFLIKKMMLGNKAEIELGQMAAQKAQHEDVKKFAQKLVQDHQQMNQELEQLQSGGQSGARSTQPAQSDPTRSGQRQPGQSNPERLGQAQSEQAAQPGQDRVAQPRPGQTQLGQAGQSRPGQEVASRSEVGQGQGQEIPQQLTQLTEQTAENTLQMARRMLEEAQQGKEFDMTFVGMQIVKHSHMVAELDSMKNVGSPQFQQLVSKAHATTQQHLDMAKDLSKKLSGDDQESRSTNPQRSGQAQPNSSQSRSGVQSSNATPSSN